MLRTEQEAKDKWCHMTLGSSRVKCLASDCMAWRWSEYTPHLYERYDQEGIEAKDVPDQRRGFCGLVGQPKF